LFEAFTRSVLNPKFRSRRDPFLIGRGLGIGAAFANFLEKKIQNYGESKVRIQTVPPKTGRGHCIQSKKTMKYSVDFSTLTKRLENK
jgi:hypothetical protein